MCGLTWGSYCLFRETVKSEVYLRISAERLSKAPVELWIKRVLDERIVRDPSHAYEKY